jgi:ribosomal protein S18 acetylase RimI-like enzyme
VQIQIRSGEHRARIADVDPLDNPAWHALVGPHRAFARGSGRAWRYDPDVAPFAALPDEPTSDDWDALADLAPPLDGEPGPVVALPRAGVRPPDGWQTVFELTAIQMLAPPDVHAGGDGDDGGLEFEPLGAADVPAMLALVQETRPGPFLPRTIELGNYIGLRDGGELVAMAGERFHLPGLTEISAVCTAPRVQRKGIAAAMVRAVARGISERGEDAFLHVAVDNAAGFALYERLGFTVRATLDVVAVRRLPD